MDGAPLHTGVGYGVVAMLGWGIGDVCAALLARRVESVRALTWVVLTGLLLVAAWGLGVGDPGTWQAEPLALAAGAGLLNTVGGLAFMHGLSIGRVSLVSPIAAAYSVVLVLAALVLLGETLTVPQAVAVGLVLSGSLLVSLDLRSLMRSSRPAWSDPGLPFAFGAMWAWGLGYLAIVGAARATGWLPTSLISGAVQVAVLGIVGLATGRALAAPVGRSALGLTALTALFGTLANVAYTIGVERHAATIIGPVSAAFPVVSLLLARFGLGERLERWQWLGTGLVLAGIVLIAIK